MGWKPVLKISPHSEYDRVAAAAQRLFDTGHGVRFRETVFRAARPECSELPDLISGNGSKLTGSRWNAPDTIRVLHASDSPESAVGEALATYRHFGVPVPSDLHLVVRGIDVDARQFLDLRHGEIRQAIRVSEDRLLATVWEEENAAGREAISQAVGRAASAAGFCGLIAPSAAVPDATNTAVFVDCLGSMGRIVLGGMS
ncbi:MAG: RES family NAD+ phosphorylase [Phycisphaerales bacterium JB054]